LATFLELTNILLARLNEVPLNSSTFSNPGGFYAQAKEAINASMLDICRKYSKMPFLHGTHTITVVSGTNSYSLSGSLNPTDWDTFYLKQDLTKSTPVYQKPLLHRDYNEYMQQQYADDVNADSSLWSQPRIIVQDLTGNGCLISPFPDQSYVINYEAWTIPTAMVNYSDVCVIPDQFQNVLVNGGMMYAMMFRENIDSATKWEGKFKESMAEMARQIVPQDPYIKSPYVPRALPLTGPTRVW